MAGIYFGSGCDEGERDGSWAETLAPVLSWSASLIVTVGKGYAKEIHERYGIPIERMQVMPNGIDLDLFVPGPRENEIRQEFGWEDRFVVLYVGTHGMAHALHVVLDAARQLQSHKDIFLPLLEKGPKKRTS